MAELTTRIDSESEKLGNAAFEDASFSGAYPLLPDIYTSFLGAYPSLPDVYTSMIVGGNPEEGSESGIRTPSMQPVVDTKRRNPLPTTHNSEVRSYPKNVTPQQVPHSASTADPSLADGYNYRSPSTIHNSKLPSYSENVTPSLAGGYPQLFSFVRANPSLADGYNYTSELGIRNPSTIHNSKGLENVEDDPISTDSESSKESVVGSSPSKAIGRKKSKCINCFGFWSKKSD